MAHLGKFEKGHIHDFDLAPIASKDGEHLLPTKACYTVNRIPEHEPAKRVFEPQPGTVLRARFIAPHCRVPR